jgi:dihydrolipoamide dehydrogenase
MADAYDLIVIGAGPGGYVAAIRAAQLGMKTAVVEKDEIGGVCLNRGCIPSKALIRNAEVLALFRRAKEFGISIENLKFDFGVAVERSQKAVERLTKGVEFLLKKNKVAMYKGTGRLLSPTQLEIKPAAGGAAQQITARHLIIASGTRHKPLPPLITDGRRIITSDEALRLNPLPVSILIVGGGATGVEFAYVFAVYGVKVTVIELMPRILPGEDEEVSKLLAESFAKLGVTIMTDCRVEGVKAEDRELLVTLKTVQGLQTQKFEKILVAAGRQPNVEDLGLEQVGVAFDAKKFIATNEFMQSNVETIYAIGDVAGKSLLAHSAMMEGAIAVEQMAGKNPPPMNYDNIPRCVYCQPQVASVGFTEEQAKAKGHEIKVGKFPFKASGKALALGETEGFIKIIADAKYGEILGVHMIGAEVTELIGEVTLAKVLEATPMEIKRTIHPHPTLSEAVMEAAAMVYGEAIHI